MADPIESGEEIEIASHHQLWMASWHSPGEPPSGKPHGAAGVCVTPDNRLILVSADEKFWELPAGRPESGESWEQTLRREVFEEACATVTKVRLLGYSCGRCVGGSERGLVLVRAFFRADVRLHDWNPAHETRFRRVVTPSEALALLPDVWVRFWRRAFLDAGLAL
jgi:8-oxo-dGTP pyrophosphatase MutT (NUDIX family)